jgi:MoaA/NifB/PqqE/SkfB family radical SAM enzyme
MLTGIHFLLSYTCNFECDHCFVFSGPAVGGTFTIRQIQEVLEEAMKIGTVEWIYFEGGEPFMFYPLMIEGVKRARMLGFRVGVVTNAYFATGVEDARLWLRPLAELGISDLSISDDVYHYEDAEDNPPRRALVCARELGLSADSICIEEPHVTETRGRSGEHAKGKPIVGGDVMFRGRAVQKLVSGLPRRSWEEFVECPHENLRDPGRVHVDCFGHVHLCQGISMGNMWETPLSRLLREYDPETHPICAPLLRGGPAALAQSYDVRRQEGYVDACHCCFDVRLHLQDRFPGILAPPQVYGSE